MCGVLGSNVMQDLAKYIITCEHYPMNISIEQKTHPRKPQLTLPLGGLFKTRFTVYMHLIVISITLKE